MKMVVKTSWTILCDGKWITIVTKNTGDLAIKTATKSMYKVLTENTSIDSYEAAMLLTLLGNISICVATDYHMTARMEFPVEILEQYGFTKKW